MVDMLKTNVLLVTFCLFIGAEFSTAVRIRRNRRVTKPKTRIPTTRVKVRNYYGKTYKSSYWKAGLAVGLVYGIASYKTRRRYLRYPDREPRICFNEEDLRNGTYGYFICPEWNQPDDYEYCCGETGQSAQGQMIPLNKHTEPVPYPTGDPQAQPVYGGYPPTGQVPGPPSYGGYGTGVADPGGFYNPNVGPPYYTGPQVPCGSVPPPYPVT